MVNIYTENFYFWPRVKREVKKLQIDPNYVDLLNIMKKPERKS
jgi:hypothetical protein